MNVSILLADPGTLWLDSTVIAGEDLMLVVRTVQPRAQCPRCHHAATRVHSR